MQQEIIKNNVINQLVEVELPDNDSFLKIRETLTRIGVPSNKANILYQSCHILFKQGRYFIVHFKELFMLDGRSTDFSVEDLARRNTIANLLEQWGLVRIINVDQTSEPTITMDRLKILSFSEKNKWELQPKYRIGKFKQNRTVDLTEHEPFSD